MVSYTIHDENGKYLPATIEWIKDDKAITITLEDGGNYFSSKISLEDLKWLIKRLNLDMQGE